MYKAYSLISKFDKNAQKLLIDNKINLKVNKSKERPKGEELIKLIKEYDILIIGGTTRITSEMINYVNKPLIIATDSVGLDHISKEFFTSPLVKILNLKTSNSLSVAEHIFSLILSLNKRIIEANQLVINNSKFKVHDLPTEISNKTLGLIGAGNISKEVIKIAKAFNMNIICYTKNPDNHKDLLGILKFTNLDTLLKTSDIITVNIPLTDETRNLISKEKINLLKKTCTFINTARPDIVDIKSLIDYADRYDTFYVGLDITVGDYKELFNKYRNNVIVTPHIAASTKEALIKMDIELSNIIIKEINNENS